MKKYFYWLIAGTLLLDFNALKFFYQPGGPAPIGLGGYKQSGYLLWYPISPERLQRYFSDPNNFYNRDSGGIWTNEWKIYITVFVLPLVVMLFIRYLRKANDS